MVPDRLFTKTMEHQPLNILTGPVQEAAIAPAEWRRRQLRTMNIDQGKQNAGLSLVALPRPVQPLDPRTTLQRLQLDRVDTPITTRLFMPAMADVAPVSRIPVFTPSTLMAVDR